MLLIPEMFLSKSSIRQQFQQEPGTVPFAQVSQIISPGLRANVFSNLLGHVGGSQLKLLSVEHFPLHSGFGKTLKL